MDEQGLREHLHRAGSIADEALATTLWRAGELQRPLLVEGDAGVGETALALALAKAGGRRLVRLQCHEGLDLSQAAYEWNYGRQLLAIRVNETGGHALREADLFAREYLLERPLLQAITSAQPAVLLMFQAPPDDPHALTATLGCLLKTREDRFQLGAERVQQLREGRRAGVAEKA